MNFSQHDLARARSLLTPISHISQTLWAALPEASGYLQATMVEPRDYSERAATKVCILKK